jgi:uncharacterized protein YecE (DUF72 family)
MSIKLNNYYSGTSGLLLPVPNKQFYPAAFQDKSRLCYYASLMDTIEINSSFYRIPQAATIKKWAADVPAAFVFSFKLFKEITHQKDLEFDVLMVEKFMQAIAHVGEKKGCLLVQLPPSIRIHHLAQLGKLMMVLRHNDPFMQWKVAFEFRHPSLYVEEVYELLANYQMAMVLHDKSLASAPIMTTHNAFVYVRFHGPNGNYRGSYAEDLLAEYATYISDWLAEGKEVFVYFNNTMGDALGNLTSLRRMLRDADQ